MSTKVIKRPRGTHVDLTPDEQQHVRTALAHLRLQFGTWEALVKVLHFEASSFIHVVAGRKVASPTMAFRVARLVGIKVDDLLEGKFLPAGTCAHCGQAPKAPTSGAVLHFPSRTKRRR